MHDFHLADQILKTAVDFAKKNKLKRITVIKIELGEIVEHGERIIPENLKFNFNLLAKNTIAQDAELRIKSIGGDTWRLREIEGEKRENVF